MKKIIKPLLVIVILLIIFFIVNKVGYSEDVVGFFGISSIILIGLLIVRYPLDLMLKLTKNETYQKYINVISKPIKTNHKYFALLAIISVATHLFMYSKGHSLNLFNGGCFPGFIAIALSSIPFIFIFIFKYIKKSKFIMKVHIYSALIFITFVLIHIILIDD